eukprot:SAG31_NODE_3635_length_4035_cov_11.591463_3_plen_440_part_00
MGLHDRIKEVEQKIATTKADKQSSATIGRLKAQLAKLRSELFEGKKDSGGHGALHADGFDVKASGDARVAMIGFPSVGKSSLLTTLTSTESESAAYEFTTLTCIPGKINYKGANIQLLDLPGIIEGAAENKGRGREVIAVGRNADMILMMLDASKGDVHRAILEKELESVGIRLNQIPANIYFVKKKTGGIKITSTVSNPKNGLNEENMKAILQEYKHHNCEVIVKEDATIDQFIDVIEGRCKPIAFFKDPPTTQKRWRIHFWLIFPSSAAIGNRKFIPCLYCYNKIDSLCLEELDQFARQAYSMVISIHWKLNLDFLLEKIWEYLDLTRVYTKPRGSRPDFSEPVILRFVLAMGPSSFPFVLLGLRQSCFGLAIAETVVCVWLRLYVSRTRGGFGATTTELAHLLKVFAAQSTKISPRTSSTRLFGARAPSIVRNELD